MISLRPNRTPERPARVLLSPARRRGALLAGFITLTGLLGCAVPQPPGNGRMSAVLEPETGRSYLLYLPESYIGLSDEERAQRRWPLVMTFHGMKPYDTALLQMLEWEREADRYGMIVVAPELLAFDFVIGQFPQNDVTLLFEADERAILAIMDHVQSTTAADQRHVLSTGFSSGGYMAHYMLNRHPERFSCLAVRQANFSPAVLDSNATDRSRDRPILIVNTENDVPLCVEESRDAIRWYEAHGYSRLAWLKIRRLAHERTPDLAAGFFARSASTRASIPVNMANRDALDGNATGLALLGWLRGG